MSDVYLPQNGEMTDADFTKIANLVYDLCGIHLHDGKKELVKARLGKRMRSGPFKSFRDYYQYIVQDQTGQELVHMLDAISTNFTNFFREQEHFDYLKTELLAESIATTKGNGKRLRFWSAGCSSGEEPYSIAITVLETLKNPGAWDLKILATDLSSKVLKVAGSGIYAKERIQTIPPALVQKYFLRGDQNWQGYVKVKEQLKQYVHFKRLNLMEPFSFPEPFDCIFCRNVMIYFDKKTRTSLMSRFYECLAKGGVLFIGHSESLAGIQQRFRYIKPAIYQKEK